MAEKNRRRSIAFRIAAVTCGLLVLPFCELVCYCAGLGEESVSEDPFVGFSGIRPLFERSADGQFWEVAESRRGFFEHDQFAVRKGDREFRIFVFGGSTVQGCPFSVETSFTRFLQLSLQTCDPSRSWKVINCGGVSYATSRLLPLMEECFQHQPDLYIMCEGHNEFLEDVTYSHLRDASSVLTSGYSVFFQFRTFRLLQHMMQKLSNGESFAEMRAASRPVLPAEVDALLDHQGGLEAYRRDDKHADGVVQHFRSNLMRMVQLCRNSDVPLLLIQPPSSLSDCPPFKAEYQASTSISDQKKIRDLLSSASSFFRRDPVHPEQNLPDHVQSDQISADAAGAVQLLQQAAEIDVRFALTWFQLGNALSAEGRYLDARNAFLRARDEDICPLRMTTPLETAMQQVANEFSCEFLNAADLLEAYNPDTIIGDDVLVDHIHPSFRGHQEIAHAISRWMYTKRFTEVDPDSLQETVQNVFVNHLQSLDDMYFLKGRRRLKDQQGWAAGRAEGPPLKNHLTEPAEQ